MAQVRAIVPFVIGNEEAIVEFLPLGKIDFLVIGASSTNLSKRPLAAY